MKKTDIGSLGDNAEDEDVLPDWWPPGTLVQLWTLALLVLKCTFQCVSVIAVSSRQPRAAGNCFSCHSLSFVVTSEKKQHHRQWKAAVPPEAEVSVQAEAQERHWAQAQKQQICVRLLSFSLTALGEKWGIISRLHRKSYFHEGSFSCLHFPFESRSKA